MWRGISVGRDPTLFDGLYGRFTIGLISLVFLGILWGAVAGEDELRQVFSTIGIYALAFFATGLLALGVANLHLIRGRALRSGESFNLLDRRWLITLVGAVLVIGLLALGAVSIFSLQVVEFFTGLLGAAANALLTAFLYGIILPLTAVASILIYLFDFLFSWIGSGEPPPPPNLELFQSVEGAVDEESARASLVGQSLPSNGVCWFWASSLPWPCWPSLCSASDGPLPSQRMWRSSASTSGRGRPSSPTCWPSCMLFWDAFWDDGEPVARPLPRHLLPSPPTTRRNSSLSTRYTGVCYGRSHGWRRATPAGNAL